LKTQLLDFQEESASKVLVKLRKDGYHLLEAGMGTGKSIMSLAIREVVQDKTCEIDLTIILAPKTLLSNWIKELEKHCVEVPYYVVWNAQKYKADYYKEEMALLNKNGGLLLVNIEAFGRKNEALELALKPLLRKEHFLILDESSRVKDQGAHRTKYIAQTFSRAKFKLAMTGTLNANTPLDVYGQFLVLDPMFWAKRGFRTWHLFRKFFGILQDIYVQGGRVVKNGKIIGFRKLDQLAGMIAPYITVIKKDEVLNLPDKVFEKLYVKLGEEEERAYEDLKRKMMTVLTSGEVVAIDQKISLYQKFRQLCGGWIAPDMPVTDEPSKLKALEDYLEGSDEQFVIFAVYTHEINQIVSRLEGASKYDGSVHIADRQQIVDSFNAGGTRFLVVQPLAGAFGLNLQTNCNNVIYYSRPNSPEVMEQSQDRIHRIGQAKTCFYLDIVAEGRIDEKVIEALDAHQDLSKLFSDISAKNMAQYV